MKIYFSLQSKKCKNIFIMNFYNNLFELYVEVRPDFLSLALAYLCSLNFSLNLIQSFKLNKPLNQWGLTIHGIILLLQSSPNVLIHLWFFWPNNFKRWPRNWCTYLYLCLLLWMLCSLSFILVLPKTIEIYVPNRIALITEIFNSKLVYDLHFTPTWSLKHQITIANLRLWSKFVPTSLRICEHERGKK